MAPRKIIRVECIVDDCEALSKYGNLCGKHYKRQWRHGDATKTLIDMDVRSRECAADNCTKPAERSRYCGNHYSMWHRYGRTHHIRNENGLGGLTSDGYWALTVDGERRLEHVLIAEQALGKPLPPGAVVHHVTENRTDNHGDFKLVICPDQAYHMLIHRLMREKDISFKFGWPNDD